MVPELGHFALIVALVVALIQGTLPLVGAHQRNRLEAADMGAPAHVAADQPGGLQHLDMLRCRGERHGEGFGEFADRPFACGQLVQHRAPRGIAERVEDGVERLRIMFNHVV